MEVEKFHVALTQIFEISVVGVYKLLLERPE
jgi:hypothetical protein